VQRVGVRLVLGFRQHARQPCRPAFLFRARGFGADKQLLSGQGTRASGCGPKDNRSRGRRPTAVE
jgi:hypothetical protein